MRKEQSNLCCGLDHGFPRTFQVPDVYFGTDDDTLSSREGSEAASWGWAEFLDCSVDGGEHRGLVHAVNFCFESRPVWLLIYDDLKLDTLNVNGLW